jgi:hypothetical protein
MLVLSTEWRSNLDIQKILIHILSLIFPIHSIFLYLMRGELYFQYLYSIKIIKNLKHLIKNWSFNNQMGGQQQKQIPAQNYGEAYQEIKPY